MVVPTKEPTNLESIVDRRAIQPLNLPWRGTYDE